MTASRRDCKSCEDHSYALYLALIVDREKDKHNTQSQHIVAIKMSDVATTTGSWRSRAKISNGVVMSA